MVSIISVKGPSAYVAIIKSTLAISLAARPLRVVGRAHAERA